MDGPRPHRRIGGRVLHALCIVLVAVTAALLLRPLALLAAAAGDDGRGLAPALVATAWHAFLLTLAVTLYRRTA